MKPLDRRTFLRGAGGILVGLPLLDAMVSARRASADPVAKPRRLVLWFTPNGTIYDEWQPQGDGLAPEVLCPKCRLPQVPSLSSIGRS